MSSFCSTHAVISVIIIDAYRRMEKDNRISQTHATEVVDKLAELKITDNRTVPPNNDNEKAKEKDYAKESIFGGDDLEVFDDSDDLIEDESRGARKLVNPTPAVREKILNDINLQLNENQGEVQIFH